MRRVPFVVLLLVLVCALSPSTVVGTAGAADERVVAIVLMDAPPLATYRGGIRGLAAPGTVAGSARLDVRSRAAIAYLDHLDRRFATLETAALTAIPDAVPLYRYGVVLGGVALQVRESDLATLAALPGVRRVLRDEPASLDTEKSPKFVGAPKLWKQVGGQESAGEGVVVGILDTGIWPEHPSFADPDPSGKPYPPPPPTWRNGQGPFCEAPGDGSLALPCNNKLIGTRRFLNSFKANSGGLSAGEFDSARDQDGHGTHTSSTAAGNAGVAATVLDFPRGIISGLAPRAHVAMYRVCGISDTGGCFRSDSAAAVQQAILDGVDAINFSIGGGTDPYNDAASLAFLDAYAAGVFVSCSAGNDGPTPNTVGHREPWVATVAASTEKRQLKNEMKLKGDETGKLVLVGATRTGGFKGSRPLVSAADFGDPACAAPFAANSVSGMVVACQRGSTFSRTIKSFNVGQGGAAAMLLFDQPGFSGAFVEAHFIPTLHIDRPASDQVIAFLAGNTEMTAKFTGAKAFNGKGDVLADFSSRGGSFQTLGVSKPDISAPGVFILAGATPTHVGQLLAEAKQGELFQFLDGTSMASPHVAAAGALLHQAHPDWTAGQIHSALMTTALTKKLFIEDATTPAGPFDVGTGRLDMAKAGNPGLTFDATRDELIAHQFDLWNANYPSLYVPQMPASLTVSRTVKSVLAKRGKFKLTVTAPPDLGIGVPPELEIEPGASATFDIAIDASAVPVGQLRHGLLILKGKTTVRFPITIVRS